MLSKEQRATGHRDMTTTGVGLSSSSDNDGRIFALDGWRGIAILLVLFDHFQASVLRHYFPWFHTGFIGVSAFFVLSGYLITGKLLEPGISLWRFYMRRFSRLMPAAWSYLIFLFALGTAIGMPLLNTRQTIGCILFFRNIQGNQGPFDWLTLHFWSLSIEEQFYLVWPAALVLLGGRKAIRLAIVVGIVVLAWSVWHNDYRLRAFATEANTPALLFGCVLSLVSWKLPARASVVLSLPGLPWLGRISYSIYIWNPVCFYLWRAFPLGWLSFVIPILSYYWIERPFIALGSQLKAKITNPASPCRTTEYSK